MVYFISYVLNLHSILEIIYIKKVYFILMDSRLNPDLDVNSILQLDEGIISLKNSD